VTKSEARPARGETRERILEVALELFNEQGYDKTSLREIAERLGITKAALYYYFERKQDILLELHLRLHDIGRGILEQIDRLENEREIVAVWPALLEQFVDEGLANRDLIRFHQRNEQALSQIADDPRHQAETEDLQARFLRLVGNPAIPLADRVRMACSVSAVLGGIAVGEILGDVPPEDVARAVREAVGDLFPARTYEARSSR
jgi:AcrR family transcriptional regulator